MSQVRRQTNQTWQLKSVYTVSKNGAEWMTTKALLFSEHRPS